MMVYSTLLRMNWRAKQFHVHAPECISPTSTSSFSVLLSCPAASAARPFAATQSLRLLLSRSRCCHCTGRGPAERSAENIPPNMSAMCVAIARWAHIFAMPSFFPRDGCDPPSAGAQLTVTCDMKKLKYPSPSMMEILRRYLERNCSNFIANVAKPERNTEKRFTVYVSFDANRPVM